MRKDLDLIVEQAERCKKIVGGLLNFARKNQMVYTRTNIYAFAQKSLQSVIIPPHVKTVIEQDLDDPMVYIDPDQMMQVLTNLEKNAIEAMPEGGCLSLHLGRRNGSVSISISDTGIGIAEENMDKLFTPFFTTKSLGKGTGLGLSLIYGIIKMHRGQIHVQSNAEPAKGPTGTTFTIEIPLLQK
jgi:signal transduction histidine kinase